MAKYFMKHEREPNGIHTFNFAGPDEVGTVAAAYRSRNEQLIHKGNPSSVSPFDKNVATWKGASEIFRTQQPGNLFAILTKYAEETDEDVKILERDPDLSTDYLLDSTARRYRFGHEAGLLADSVLISLWTEHVCREAVADATESATQEMRHIDPES